jgi:hypothetical protein
MKYNPKYFFADAIFIESITLDACDGGVTLLARIADAKGITSVKHLFCQTDQLATFLMTDSEDADTVLTYIVMLMEIDAEVGYGEIDVEELIGRPLTFADKRLRLYHPLIQKVEDGPMDIDEDLYEIDLILPKH